MARPRRSSRSRSGSSRSRPRRPRRALESGDAVLVDTRDAVNREDARIEGDHYAPAGQGAGEAHTDEFASAVEEAAGGRDKRVILYCGAGNRSAVAADALTEEHGFENVASMARRHRPPGRRRAARS